jgi:PAS domain S-box-containing protein
MKPKRKPQYKVYKITLAVFFFLSLICVSGSFATKNSFKNPIPFNAGSEIGYPPFCVVDSDGQANGFSVELMRAALKAMGQEATFRTGPWADVKGWLEQGKIQALPLVGRTPEREFIFDFTFPYMSFHGAIVVRKDTTDIHDIADLRSRQVAVMKGDNAEEFVRRKDHGFKIHTTITFEDALRELSDGLHDAVIIQRLVALRLIQEAGLTNLRVLHQPLAEYRQDWCFAVREGDRDTLSLLNEGLALVMADGTYSHLHSKWFAALELPSNRRIVIGGDHNYPPFEYIDENGRPKGYNVDLTRAIAQKVGLDIEIRLGPWADIQQGLALGEIDAIQGMLYSTDRGLTFDFTPPHTAINCVSVVRKGEGTPPNSIEELKGKRIVVQQGDIMHEFAIKNGLSGSLTEVATQEQALRELARGQYDCALVARIPAMYLIKQFGWENLVFGQHSILNAEYCYAVPKNKKALLSQLSEGMKVLEESGEYRRIYEKWLGVYKDSPFNFWSFLRYAAIFMVPVLLLLLFFFLWSWSLRRQVLQRTAELAKSQKILNETGKMGKIGGWEHDLLTGKALWTEALFDILEIPYDQPPPGVAEHLSYYTLRDQKILEKSYNQAIEDGTPFDLELEGYTSKKRPIWCRVQGKPLFENNTCVKLHGTFQEITYLKRAQEELLKSERQLRTLVDTIPDLIWLKERNGVYLSCNTMFERFFGAKESAIVGKTDYDFVDKNLADFFREHDQKAMAAGRPSINEESLTFAENGYKGLFETIKSPMYDADGDLIGVLGIARDISERKNAENRLRESEQRYKSAQHMGQVGNLEYDLVTENFWGSDQAKRIYGFDSKSKNFTADEVENCIPDRERVHQALVDLIEKNKPYDLEIEIHPVSGPKRKFIRSIAQLQKDDSGMPYKVTGVIQDITRRKEEEAEKQKLELNLLQAQKIKAIGTLAGGIAHDFNNILYPIIGFTEMSIQDLPDTHPVQENLQDILQGAKRARDLVKQILAFSDQRDLEYKPLALQPIIQETIKLLRSIIPSNIDIQKEICEQDIYIVANTTEFHEVVMNLCTNAYHAMEETGGVLTLHLEEVRPSKELKLKEDKYCCFTVSDTGTGIPSEIQNNIFEPYFTTKEQGKGSGLGLSVVHGIVKSYKGAIDIKSQKGKGTTIKVYFPIISKPGMFESNLDEQFKTSGNENILLVDDEQAIVKLGIRMLERIGYTVTGKTSSTEALELFKSNPDGFDLVITDMTMPIMLGTELAEKILKIRNDIPILICTGFSERLDEKSTAISGIKGYVNKPILQEDLAVTVRELLDKYKGN